MLATFMFLGTIAIFVAAILISSKKAVRPKVRIWAFSFYTLACIFLATVGALMMNIDPEPYAGAWLIIQQVFLFFINMRGIYHAIKEIKLLNAVKELKFGYENRS